VSVRRILSTIVVAAAGVTSGSAAFPVSPPGVAGSAREPPGTSAAPGGCAPAPTYQAATVAARWPSLIGQRIAIDGVSIERAIDFTEVLVAAGGHRFAVVMSPAAERWTGRARRVFRVLGSTRVSLFGRTVLPELLLEDRGCPK